MSIGTVAEIWRYPVSSAGGEQLQEADLDAGGVVGDRLWCLIDSATGEVAYPEKRKRWRGAPQLLARHAAGVEIRTGSEPWVAGDGEEGRRLLERHFGFPVELRPAIPEQGMAAPDAVKPRYRREAIHLLTTASMAELSRRLPGSAIDPRRFRPNLVIRTEADASGLLEQAWMGREVQVGSARLEVIRPCMRCAFTVLPQQELDLDPAILAEITAAADGAFGVLCRVTAPGRVRLGSGASLGEHTVP